MSITTHQPQPTVDGVYMYERVMLCVRTWQVHGAEVAPPRSNQGVHERAATQRRQRDGQHGGMVYRRPYGSTIQHAPRLKRGGSARFLISEAHSLSLSLSLSLTTHAHADRWAYVLSVRVSEDGEQLQKPR